VLHCRFDRVSASAQFRYDVNAAIVLAKYVAQGLDGTKDIFEALGICNVNGNLLLVELFCERLEL
jgi:hypothetical protein